jgi:uncharacterized protein with NRDE domain
VCTVLFAWQWRPDVPVVLAANRDERIGRPSDPPMRLHASPDLWGGRDRLAGGTWLAVDPAARRLCAVTNRHLADAPVRPPDPTLRSRGELPVRLLTGSTGSTGNNGNAGELGGLRAEEYNPVNVLWLAPEQAWWSSLDGRVDLEPGVHALTVQDVDDPSSAKTQRLLALARRAADDASDAQDLRDRLAAVLRSHDTDPGGPPQSAACIHGDEYGTVSSSTVVVDSGGVELAYAAGRPCVTPYALVNLTEPTSPA